MADAAAAEHQPCADLGFRHRRAPPPRQTEAARCLERRGGGGDDEAGDYADPGYQPDGAKRYPLDSESHVRAAWASIHQPGNADRYTEAQLAHLKARIVAAWQEKVDPAGPPATGVGGKAAAADTLRKRPDEIRRIGQIIGDLEWLCGVSHRLVPATAPADKAVRGGDLAKALAGEIMPRLDALAKRVEDIAATPLPPQTVARGLSKREDGGGLGFGDDIVTALSRMSDEETHAGADQGGACQPDPAGRLHD